jgi:hypothetical protein
MTAKQLIDSGLAALVTLMACACSFYAATPDQLAACGAVAIAGFVAFGLILSDDNG